MPYIRNKGTCLIENNLSECKVGFLLLLKGINYALRLNKYGIDHF
jgi:hypothetical protein